jgi:type VI secretion system secreted protein VgrG
MPRVVEATTPLPAEALQFLDMYGTEALSTLFDFRVKLLSTQIGIAPKTLLGNDITLAVETENNGPKRYFSGICTRFAMNGRQGEYHLYEARLQPWLWLASRRSDSKIFQQKKVPDIVQEVLGKYGFPIVRKLSGTYRVWDYCVQYHETDLNFVSRIMEHEGIYYYFEHGAGVHRLVLCDGFASHTPLSPRASVNYYGIDAAAVVKEEHFYAWRPREELDPGEYISDDYDFSQPKVDLATKNRHPAGHTFDAWERYQWPGGYTDLGDGERYAQTRMEALQAEQVRATGEGSLRTLAPGYLMTLVRCPRSDQNREHLIVGINYYLKDNSYGSTLGGDSGTDWNFSVLTQPSNQPYRPQKLTQKPRSQGPQVAVVVGPPGEEIYTDEYGRVKVQFPWDRYGANDQNSSCWMRVSHPWAGSNYGAIHIPRIGQEVIVDHIDGDPDYPIITGRVYNADQMPPWSLPDNKTQSGVLTRSSKGGAAGAGMKAGAGDANAIRFEDKKGEEQLWLHAQKDQLTEVENDETKWVGRDRRKTIDRDELNHIQRDRTETVDRNETITVHGQRDEEVDKNETIAVHHNRSRTVDMNESVSIGKSRNKKIGNNEIDKIGKTWSINVGRFKTETIGMAYMQNVGLGRMENVGAGYNLNVGAVMATVVGLNQFEKIGRSKSVSVGKTFKLEAGDAIELVVGKSVLVMKKDGSVTINGKDVDIVGSKHIQLDSKRIDLN